MKSPLIGITMGDPAGVGPEITVQALEDPELRGTCRLVAFGDSAALDRAMDMLRVTEPFDTVESAADLQHAESFPLFWPVSRDAGRVADYGKVTKEGGRAAGLAIETAAGLAMQGVLDAIATGPIHKEGLRLAGYPYPGHTEFLAYLTRSVEPVMMLMGERLRVTLVTIHLPLREVFQALSPDAILRTVLATYQGLVKDFGIRRPRLAVAGLNPHAGEGGLFGDEEEFIIAPAVNKARMSGLDVTGPLPPDTVFVHASAGRFDAVVCMYHDQGLIPLKLLHFADGVNVTLGLPIVRTSVDHGTAYDIAGTGKADPRSLIQAVKTAAFIAENRKKSGY